MHLDANILFSQDGASSEQSSKTATKAPAKEVFNPTPS
jgi:hypothetical protein